MFLPCRNNRLCFTYIDESKLFFRQPVKDKKKENYWLFQDKKKLCKIREHLSNDILTTFVFVEKIGVKSVIVMEQPVNVIVF